MPPTVRTRATRRPRDRRIEEGGCFYAAEAVRLAGIRGLNYRQLRRLLRIVKGATLDDRRWAQFSLRDVVALKVAYSLASGKQTNHKYPRLHFAEVEKACESLRTNYGVADPLTQVRLGWDGGEIVAQLEGAHFETLSGQLLLDAASVTKNASNVAWLSAQERTQLETKLKSALRVSQKTKSTCSSLPAPLKFSVGGLR